MNIKKVSLALLISCFFQISFATEQHVIKGQVMTGINRYLGNPVWDLGPILGYSGFDLVYEYLPGEARSRPVDQSTPNNAVLATGLNENYISLFGVSPDTVSENIINIPLNDTPVISSPGMNAREDFDNIFDVKETSNSRVFSSKEITLKQWKKAKGRAKVSCNKKASVVRFNLHNMSPNSLYTAWAVYGVDSNSDGIYDALLPRPFGGVPNVVTTNASGDGRLARKIPVCPMSDESDLLWVEFDYHADGAVYGGVPDLTLEGFPSGIISQPHMAFGFKAININ